MAVGRFLFGVFMLTLQFSGNATTGQVKEITHAGRRYLVSPVVALREGILNDTYVSAAEFGKFAQSWAGRPIPIAHPRADGLPTSANTPDIWANDVLGHLWNVAVDGGALKGEIWIDLDKAQMMGERAVQIVNKLRANQPLEVSTGYFCEMEATPGTFNGYAYGGIARNIRPDHLAILPDEIGACSWADGCGTPRVNSQEDSIMSMDEQTLFQRFLGWLKNEPPQNIEPVVVDNSATTQETVLEANISAEEDLSVNKTELIGALVANAKCKFSQEKLAAWDEGDLQVLSESLEETPPPSDTAGSPLGAPAPVTPVAQDAELVTRIAALEDLIKGLAVNVNEERAGLVAGIVANCRGAFQAADLARFDTGKLRDIYGSYQPRDYSANAGTLRVNGPEEEELLMQWPVFAKKEG
jgi:Uncharacterized protein conserved in bacteria (DUF2213)